METTSAMRDCCDCNNPRWQSLVRANSGGNRPGNGRVCRANRRDALPGGRAGGREPGQPGLRPQQAERLREGRHYQPASPPVGRDHDRGTSGTDRPAEPRPGRPRHPGAVAAAEADRRAAGAGGGQPAEGRRRVPSRERGPHRPGPAAIPPLHAGGHPADAPAEPHQDRRGQRGGGGPQRHRGQADGHHAHAAEQRRPTPR